MNQLMSHLRNFRRDCRGSPALEFALISPLFFAVVFGTFELGRGLYERNRIAAAAAIASRTVALDTSSSNSEIIQAIYTKLDDYDVDDLNIVIATETIAGQDFKKIEISYHHELIVKLGGQFSYFTLTATRFAPAIS